MLNLLPSGASEVQEGMWPPPPAAPQNDGPNGSGDSDRAPRPARHAQEQGGGDWQPRRGPTPAAHG
eukprot:11016886-Alexandrium_andersonii.AAC.1